MLSLGMLPLRKNNPAIVSHGTGMKPGKLAAQVMGFQTGIGEIFRHAPQRLLNLRLQRRVLADHTAE